jgi:PBSX family phage terminase large subunit
LSIEIVSELTQDDLDPRNQPYTPHGKFVELFYYQGREVLLSGPAGTGKSICASNRLFMFAEQYPGCRILIVRKTRESMSQSTLVTWESKVVPTGHPCLAGPSRRNRDSYTFTNGSEIICGGMKQSGRDATQKIMSTDYDFIYAPEAIEFSSEEYGRLLSRLRNNVSPFKQIITDTNPSHPQHWLKRRCDDGLCKMIETRHRDNPLLYDHAKNDWTPFGREYLNSLESLEGALRDRLYLGKWAQAEGVVYTNWNDQIHVIDDFEIPKHWKRYCAVDFGVNDPFVAIYGAQDPDTKKVYFYREYVRTSDIIEHHAAEMKKMEKGEKIEATICDHEKNARLTLEKHLGRSTCLANKKEIMAGIDCMQTFLKNQADGRPGLFVFESLRNTFDKTMDERKLPMGIIQEMPSYVWDQSVQKGIKDKPIDRDNHSLDCGRYLVMYIKDNTIPWVPPDAMKTPEPVPTFQRPRGPLNNMPQFRRNNQSPFGR